MSLPLGGFSFNVDANIARARQAFAELVSNARQTAQQVERALHLNATPQVNATPARTALNDLSRAATQAATTLQRPITVNVDTQGARREIESLTRLQEGALRGGLRGAGLGASVPLGVNFGAQAAVAVTAAAAAEKFVSAIKDGIEAGIQYNSQLQIATQAFTLYTGSVNEANKALADLRRNADITPFDTKEVIESGQVFIRVARGSREEMMELLKQAEALAATNPFQGLQGATISIQELLGGQVESIANRFNVSREAIHQLVAEGKSGLELVRAVVKEAGGSEELIARLGQTFSGRLSTVNSAFAEFGRRLTEPSFLRLSDTLGEITRELDKNGKGWNDVASAVGEAIGFFGDLQGVLLFGKGANTLLSPEKIVPPTADVKGTEETTQALEKQVNPVTALRREAERLATELAKQERSGDRIARAMLEQSLALAQVKYAAAEVTREYELQLSALSRQLSAFQRPDFAGQLQSSINGGLQSSLALRKEEALGSPEARADIAASNVRLEAESKLLNIQNRRAEIAAQLVEFANRGKSATDLEAEASARNIRSLQDRVSQDQQARREAQESLQDQIRGQQQLRQDALESLRDRIKGEQDLRREALDSLRERQRAENEYRADALEGLREATRLEQERRSDAKIAATEARQVADDYYRSTEQGIERAHQASTAAYRDDIDKLREKLNTTKEIGKTEAEQALAKLNAQEAEYQRQRSASSALTSVAGATTIREKINAIQNFQELQHNQAVAKQKEQLEARIAADKEAQQRRQQEAQAQINQLELRARAEDRQYQQDKAARDLAHEKEVEAQRVADRAADKLERETARNEANALREAEKVDREADRQAAAALRLEEKADREATKKAQQETEAQELADKQAERKEQADLLVLERANRAADKADQIALRDAERAAADARDKAQEEAYNRNLAKQKEADERQTAAYNLELQRLANEEAGLKLQDTSLLAALASYEVLLNNSIARTTNEIKIRDVIQQIQAIPLQAQMWDVANAQQLMASYSKDLVGSIDLRIQKLGLEKLEHEKITAEIKEQIRLLDEQVRKGTKTGVEGEEEAKPKPLDFIFGKDTPIGNGFKAIDELFAGIGKFIAEGWARELDVSGDPTGVATRNWVEDNIIDQANQQLGIRSPSTKFAEMARWSVKGYTDEFDASGGLIGQSMTAAFDFAWSQWLNPYLVGPGGLIEQVTFSWESIPALMQASSPNFGAVMSEPFTTFATTFMPTFTTDMETAGRNASTAWLNGWTYNDITRSVQNSFRQITETVFPLVNVDFKTAGANAGISWQNGYLKEMDAFDASSTFYSDGKRNNQRAMQQSSLPFELGSPVSNRAFGGPVFPDRLYRVNEDTRYTEFFAPGTVVPGDAIAREIGAAVGAGRGGGGSNRSVSIVFANGAFQTKAGVDEQGLAERIGRKVLNTIVSELDMASESAPNPVSRSLPGAL